MSVKPIPYHDTPYYHAEYQPQLVGRTILSAWWGKDAHGYDLLTLVLDDGKVMQAHEQGQAGYFEIKMADKQ